MPKPAKKRGRGVRYTKPEKVKILAAAKKGKMTGQQVAEQFGISTLTFYRWRGPVRKDAVARQGKRGPGRPTGSANVRVDPSVVREAVRAQIQKMLPGIIQEEVAAAVGKLK